MEGSALCVIVKTALTKMFSIESMSSIDVSISSLFTYQPALFTWTEKLKSLTFDEMMIMKKSAALIKEHTHQNVQTTKMLDGVVYNAETILLFTQISTHNKYLQKVKMKYSSSRKYQTKILIHFYIYRDLITLSSPSPVSRHFLAVFSRSGTFWSVSETFAPSFANSTAVAAPIPEAVPIQSVISNHQINKSFAKNGKTVLPIYSCLIRAILWNFYYPCAIR